MSKDEEFITTVIESKRGSTTVIRNESEKGIVDLFTLYREADDNFNLTCSHYISTCALHFVSSLVEDYTDVTATGDMEKAKEVVHGAIATFMSDALIHLSNLKVHGPGSPDGEIH